MRGGTLTVLGVKYRMVDNFVREIRSHLWIHVAAGIVTLLMVVVGGGVFFWWLFQFLLKLEPFGQPLMERLVAMVLLAFFSMLTFSNLIITLTTTYISKETEFLMALPLRFRTTFVVKLIESIFYSSWAFALLSIPLFAAYGVAKSAPALFYPCAMGLALPFVVIPASLGAVITMLISAYLPAKKARLYAAGLLAAALGLTAGIVKLMGLRSILASADIQDFSQIMAFLNAGSVPLLPNYWLARGLESASAGNYRECGYWFLCLVSTALMFLQVCIWMAPHLYYRGWTLAKESASATHTTGGRSIFPFFDRVFLPLSPPMRALFGKDMRTFWRDPAQWSQLVILFGLLVIYIANIRGLSNQMSGMERFLKQWPVVLSFFNIGATCFVLSILTTRFVYPMLSLEGKQYWVVGLAPFPKHKLVWEKYAFCVAGAVGIGIPLMLLSNHMLKVSFPLALIGIVTILVLSFGLTSLAVGFGAIFPNLKEDNPARIANGLGGTINIVLSLFYVTFNFAAIIPPTFHLMNLLDLSGSGGRGPALIAREAFLYSWPYLAILIIFNAMTILLPMRFGIRQWNRLEFHQ